MGVVATKEAVKSAKLDVKNKIVGLFFGTAIGGIAEPVFQDGYVHANQENYRKVPIAFCHSGNPFGATGVLQVISSLLSIQYNFIPPTIRTSKKGYEDMNIVTQTQYKEVSEVAVTNHGYGGNNACAYIKKF